MTGSGSCESDSLCHCSNLFFGMRGRHASAMSSMLLYNMFLNNRKTLEVFIDT